MSYCPDMGVVPSGASNLAIVSPGRTSSPIPVDGRFFGIDAAREWLGGLTLLHEGIAPVLKRKVVPAVQNWSYLPATPSEVCQGIPQEKTRLCRLFARLRAGKAPRQEKEPGPRRSSVRSGGRNWPSRSRQDDGAANHLRSDRPPAISYLRPRTRRAADRQPSGSPPASMRTHSTVPGSC